MEDQNEEVTKMREEELDKLGGLIQILLFGDIVQSIAGIGGEIQDGGQSDRGDMEGNQPDREDLGQTDIESEVVFIVR